MRKASVLMWAVIGALAAISVGVTAQQTKTTNHKPAVTKQEATARADVAPNPMRQLAPFAGKWRANIEANNGNPPMRVDVDMKWAENHRAISFEVWFTELGAKPKRAPEYSGVYLYDPAKKAFMMYQVNSKGDLSTGRIEGDGKNFTQKTHVDRMNGTTQEQDSVIVFDDDKNAFNWRVSVQKDGQWVEAVKLRYERVKTSAKAGGMQ